MAMNRFLAISLTALLLFSAANPFAHGQVPALHNTLNIAGQLCCTPTGNCPGASVPGQIVRFTCSSPLLGINVPIGQTTTDVNGKFSLSIANGILSGLPLPELQSILPNCTASVQLPLPSEVCGVLSGTQGLLVATFRILNVVIGVVGAVINIVLNVFQVVS